MASLDVYRWLLGAETAAYVALWGWAYPRLPERVATHFSLTGIPDGFSGRAEFVMWYSLMLVLVASGLLVLARVLPRMPPELINIPHREHWLEPPRRASTLRYVERLVLEITAVTVGLLVAVAGVVIAHDLGRGDRLGGGFGLLVGAYLAYVLGRVVTTHLRFRVIGP